MAERGRERYPGYDVLAKRDGPSWNEATRLVVDSRLELSAEHRSGLDEAAWRALTAVCDRIVPQPPHRSLPVPLAAMLARKIAEGRGEGYRDAAMPPFAEAWRLGLAALDAEAMDRLGAPFCDIDPVRQDDLLRAIQTGDAGSTAWGGMPPAKFFKNRLLHDVVAAYYAHPHAWSEIGFGGPASPRGYVRMGFNRRDPWEPVEAASGQEAEARRTNLNVR